MKTFSAVLLLLLLGVLPAQTLWSQAAAPAPAAQASGTANDQSKIDPAKEADIRRLLEIVGVKTLAAQMMNQMMESMRPVLSNSLPAGDYRDKLIDLFLAKFRSKTDTQELVDLAVPIYDKHLSHEEIKGLIQFYQSPLGKKALTELPQMTSELQTEGRKWGQTLGRDSMQEVLAEHPDLAAALESAGKSAQH
jgi:hypothetical protein